MMLKPRDVVLIKRCGNASKETAFLKQFSTHFKAKREKGVGTPLPRFPTPIHPCLIRNAENTVESGMLRDKYFSNL